MLTTIKELYGWHRAHGKTARAAIVAAREDIFANAKRYGREVTGWNPAAKDGSRWIESLEGAGLRFVDYADKLARLDHTGWYCDSFESDTFRGCVLQLTGHDGRARYLAAYEDPHNKGTYRVDVARGIIMGEPGVERATEDGGARDAARFADGFAEHDAEESRTYDEAWQAGSRYADMKADESSTRQRILELCREIKLARHDMRLRDIPNVCATLRATIAGLVESLYESRHKREEMTEANGFWIRDYGAAFNEGAGETVFEGV